jgi:hypothetical protein
MDFLRSARCDFTVLLAIAVLSLAACSVTPGHDIRPTPDYIRAGVKVGDTLEIETKDGRSIGMVVTEVRASAIASDSEVIDFADIASITKRSWQAPEHPCGGGRPVGCSIPEVVLVLSHDYKRQAGKFQPACVMHDFCYRHGFATYGEDRAACDDDFLAAMKSACSSLGPLSMLDAKEFAICQAAALQTFDAVRRYGEPHFLKVGSSYCEYR